MADFVDPPPPPSPPPAQAPPPPGEPEPPDPQVREALEAWEKELDQVIAQMSETIGAAVEEHEAGKIDVATLQKRCLEAGVVRTGDMLVMWDWVNGKVFSYDGFQMVELTEMQA